MQIVILHKIAYKYRLLFYEIKFKKAIEKFAEKSKIYVDALCVEL